MSFPQSSAIKTELNKDIMRFAPNDILIFKLFTFCVYKTDSAKKQEISLEDVNLIGYDNVKQN